MFYKKNIFILFLFLFFSFSIIGDPKIKKIFPKKPFIGTELQIIGQGFEEPGAVNILFNDIGFEYDSLNLIEWTDDEISLILPDLKENKNYIKIFNSENDHTKKFYANRTLNREYFNPIKYTLHYSVRVGNLEKKNMVNGKVYLYIPQPVISDELIDIRILKIDPLPKLIQDNGVFLFEIDPEVTKNFRFDETFEITTYYKKIIVNDIEDRFTYTKDSPLYEFYTREEPPFIIPNDKTVKSKLRQILGTDNEFSAIEKVRLIYNWVIRRMRHKYPPDDRSPLYSMREGLGDCLSDAYLFVSLVRSAGIPVRLNSGYIFYHGWKVGGRHFWEEVLIPGAGWIPIDISFSHSPGFLKHHNYQTSKEFYFGGNDGRRMALSKGRVRLMQPDEEGNLYFKKYVENLQVPRIETSKDGMRVKYQIKKTLLINKIEELYDNEDNWFIKGK